jgi:hypothetical protein
MDISVTCVAKARNWKTVLFLELRGAMEQICEPATRHYYVLV